MNKRQKKKYQKKQVNKHLKIIELGFASCLDQYVGSTVCDEVVEKMSYEIQAEMDRQLIHSMVLMAGGVLDECPICHTKDALLPSEVVCRSCNNHRYAKLIRILTKLKQI